MSQRKKIRTLTSTTWWDAGQNFSLYAEDDTYLMFENSDGKACAVERKEEGKLFIFLKPSEHQEYYAENRREVLEQKRTYRRELKEQVLKLLGGRCKKCGYDQSTALDVKGGQARGQKGYTAYYNQILRIVEMSNEHPYYLLCANCQRLDEEMQTIQGD